MQTTNDWCTYTLDRNEAYKYRFEDRSPNRWAKVSGQVYVKYVKLFHFDKKERKYWLPPVTWWNRKAMMGFWQEIHVDPIMKLWEWQQKTIDYCSRSFSQWVSSILVVSETATGKSIQMLGLVAKFKCKTLIVVPSEAIVPEMGVDKLFLYKSGKAQPVSVVTGIRTEAAVQIVDGIKQGDTVIVSGTLQLRMGLPVVLDNVN